LNSEQLRSLQDPLKARYRAEPASALVTLRVDGGLTADDVSCSVATGQALTRAGLHTAGGGDGTLACSGDMLLQALVACAGVTLRSVATNRGIRVTGAVHAEGDLDFRGILGVDREASAGFSAIRLRFDIESDASPEELEALLATTKRYCTVYQTLSRPPELSIRFEGAVNSAP
jgi:uncharacterized OsmC-like protein